MDNIIVYRVYSTK